MSNDQSIDTAAVSPVEVILEGMEARKELLPGARSYLAKRFATGNEGGGLEPLVNFLAGDDGKRYWNPERPAGPKPESPLRSLIRRFAPVLRASAADDLVDQLGIEIDPETLATKPGEVAARVWRTLAKFEHRSKWLAKHQPPLPHRTRQVLECLQVLEHHLSPATSLEALAHTWRDAAGTGKSPADVMKVVIARLRSPLNSDVTIDGKPAEIGPDEYFASIRAASGAGQARGGQEAQGHPPEVQRALAEAQAVGATERPANLLEQFVNSGNYEAL